MDIQNARSCKTFYACPSFPGTCLWQEFEYASRWAHRFAYSILVLNFDNNLWSQVLAYLREHTNLNNAQWVGYLSSTGVYGDWGGQLVDER